jgi:hypothetical protein
VNSPNIKFHDDGATATEFQLEETGFPAIASDGRLVALAFHELQVTGPPALELTLQFRSVASGKVVYEAAFREPYQGELGNAYLDALRRRVRQWLRDTQRKLTQADLVTMNRTVHDASGVCGDDETSLALPNPPLQVNFRSGRLAVRDSEGTLFEHAYPEWSTAYVSQGQRCVFKPYLTEVSFDPQHQVLVIRADHCSPGDMCTKGVRPNFAVIALHQPQHQSQGKGR